MRSFAAICAMTWVSALGAPICQAAEELTEVIVTAQRRSEKLQDVPEAITALGGDSIERLNLHTTEDIVRQIPSLSMQAMVPGEATLTLRGLGTDLGLSPTVSYYFNEVPLDTRTDGYSGTPSLDLFDVDRIEVLRGPQGTLYGASSMGGAIRILTRQPDPGRFSLSSELGGSGTEGGDPAWVAKTAVNLPLSDAAAVRLVGTYQRYAGFIDRAEPASSYLDPVPIDPIVQRNANSGDLYSARLMARWNASDTFSITPSLVLQKSTLSGSSNYDSNLPRYTIATYYPEPLNSRLIVGNLLLEKDFDAAHLMLSSSYVSKNVDFDHDFSVLMTALAPLFGIPEPQPNFPTHALDLSHNNGFIESFA